MAHVSAGSIPVHHPMSKQTMQQLLELLDEKCSTESGRELITVYALAYVTDRIVEGKTYTADELPHVDRLIENIDKIDMHEWPKAYGSLKKLWKYYKERRTLIA